MIPIGGIQMVHTVPTSRSAPLSQQGAQQSAPRLPPRQAPPEDPEILAPFGRGRALGVSSGSPPPVVREQEESIRTCTKAIASLRIDPDELADGKREGWDRVTGLPHSASSPEEGQPGRSPPAAVSPPSPAPPGSQHFRASRRCPSPAPRTPADAPQSTKTSKDIS